MWVFNYTIKCTIRHNYQRSEPETAHNRRVIYCSPCLHYSARSLMMPGCLHTALLPWKPARHHHAGLTNGVPVLGPWIVSEASAASPGVKGLAGRARKAGHPPCPLTHPAGWSQQGRQGEGSISPPESSSPSRVAQVLGRVSWLAIPTEAWTEGPAYSQLPRGPGSAVNWLCDLGPVLAPFWGCLPVCEVDCRVCLHVCSLIDFLSISATLPTVVTASPAGAHSPLPRLGGPVALVATPSPFHRSSS